MQQYQPIKNHSKFDWAIFLWTPSGPDRTPERHLYCVYKTLEEARRGVPSNYKGDDVWFETYIIEPVPMGTPSPDYTRR